MKRKITYGLLIFLLFAAVYLVLRFTFGFFTTFNYWTAEQDLKNGKIQIIEVGEMPLNMEQKQNLARSYGFNFYLFGCNVPKDEIKGIEYYNKKMIDHLEAKYGIGWWAKFQSQLDSIDSSNSTDLVLDKIVGLVAEQQIVKEKVRLIDSLSENKRSLSFIPTLLDSLQNRYLVKVTEDNGVNLVTYYNFLVDGNTMTILNANGKLDGQ